MLMNLYNIMFTGKFTRTSILALGCLLLSQTVLSQTVASQDSSDNKYRVCHALPEFQAKYAIEYYGLKAAEAHYKLSYTDTGYKFSQKTELSGFASMFADDTVTAVSIVDVIDNKLLLKKHRYIQTGKKKNRDEDIDIHWLTTEAQLKGKITGIVRNKKIELETDTAIWEALSFQLPLMIEADKNIKNYPYTAILKGKIDTYNFVLKPSKKIKFADKKYDALHLVRTDPRKNRQLHIWLLPELHNIPVIIENYRKGSLHSKVELESVQFNNKKILLSNLIEDDDEF